MESLHETIHHIRQSINIPAHTLARNAVSNYPSNIWMEVVPDVIFTAVQADT